MPPKEPERFQELCKNIGMALMMGQKVQFALAHYYSLYHIVNSGWPKEKAQQEIGLHLSKPMGVVIKAIERDAPLEFVHFTKVKEFRDSRNWLAHDFDAESTQFLVNGERFEHYIDKINKISLCAFELMQILDSVGENLIQKPSSS